VNTPPIPVKGYPFERAFNSFDAAIQGATNHPLQGKAQDDTALLSGASLVDGYWTGSDLVLQFSNERWLHVFERDHRARGDVVDGAPDLGDVVQRVGASPIILDWGAAIGECRMDLSSLMAKRRGAEFQHLFVNECGFYVYMRQCLILAFHVVRRLDVEEDMLFVTEED
jgi:hypothetical protein